ncbi:MAG: methylated-DNA--[protein]-cysteine S-methyltransferase [Firmicutes bacterium]|nr:methylated-DNA--[protein]-cysteine S-methyltransferase [Bacillota bacterium]
MLVASSQEGVVRLLLPTEPEAEFFAWLRRVFAGEGLGQDEEDGEGAGGINALAIAEINAYLSGRLSTFSAPVDMRGSDFRRAVWRKIAGIPYGRTATYGEIAAAIGRPGGARAVGAASGANPVPIIIPCHRVIGAGGSLVGYGGGLELKRHLLDLEARCMTSR